MGARASQVVWRAPTSGADNSDTSEAPCLTVYSLFPETQAPLEQQVGIATPPLVWFRFCPFLGDRQATYTTHQSVQE